VRHWFVGFDPRDDLASRVAIRSMVRTGSTGVKVVFLRDHELRRTGLYWRSYEVRENGQMIDNADGKPFSTAFSFSRFIVPELARQMGIHEPVLFTDPDIMLRANVNELFDAWDDTYSVMCVQHNHNPEEATKFDGIQQTKYFRKNWSSVMLIHPDKTQALTPQKVNNQTGAQLHALLWAGADENIGALDPAWNHLVGYNEPNPNAKLVHFTLGTPDIPGRGDDEFADEWRSYLEPDEAAELLPQVNFDKSRHTWKAKGGL
jgi:hypothetical protein